MNIEKKYRIASFATAFVIFALVLLPCVISDGGIWVYYGDYVEFGSAGTFARVSVSAGSSTYVCRGYGTCGQCDKTFVSGSR